MRPRNNNVIRNIKLAASNQSLRKQHQPEDQAVGKSAASSNGIRPFPGDVIHGDDVDKVYRQLVVRDLARERLRQVQEERLFVPPPSSLTLADELDEEPIPVVFTVERLHFYGANTPIIASYKTGKTTLAGNLLKCLCDGSPFLDKFAVNRYVENGRVAYWNYELTKSQFMAWLRDLNIERPELASTLNLRGYRMPLMVPSVQNWAIEWLKRRQVVGWIIDPFSRAYGGEEKDNTEAGRWLEAIDIIKQKAGVEDVWLPTHMGRERFEEDAERARGATRLEDWADCLWYYTKDKEGNRSLRADGRDVYVEAQQLSYDQVTRKLAVLGSRKQVRASKQEQELMEVVGIVRNTPGLSQRKLKQAMPGDTDTKQQRIDKAIKEQLIYTKKEGTALCHYPTDTG